MEEFLSKDVWPFISSPQHHWLGVVAGVIAVIYVVVLGLGRLFDVWRSFQTRRAILEEEKIFNEILKIRYEIEVLRKHNDLPDLTATATDRPLAASPQHAASVLAGVRTHGRFGFSLPEVPSFSFAPVLSLFKVRLGRPEPGVARAYWALKLLMILLLAYVVGVVLVMVLVPAGSKQTPGPQEAVGVTLTLVAGLIGAYLLLVSVFNLGRAAFAALATHGPRAPLSAEGTEGAPQPRHP
jgi:hypothetical protein